MHFTALAPGEDINNPSVDNEAGVVVADGQGRYVVSPSVNIIDGEYRAMATFVYDIGTTLGLVKSVPCDYEITDPYERTGASPADVAVEQSWTKIEDCFDSELGGPWLRDMTMKYFDKYKIRSFIPEALLAINQQMPYTSFTETSFPYTANDGQALMAQALLCSSVRHLMRSYTEQPDVVSSPVAFMDRKRYQQAWSAIYAIEEPLFERWLNRWKLRTYDLSSASLLLGTKSGRMLPAPMRSRNSGRGYGGY